MEGDTALRRAVFRDTVTGQLETYAPPEGETFGVFVFAGYEPASRLVGGLAELTGQGSLVIDMGITDEGGRRLRCRGRVRQSAASGGHRRFRRGRCRYLH